MSEGGGASAPCSIEGEPVAERVVDGAEMVVSELLSLGEKRLALLRYHPPVEILGVFVAVQGGPLLLDALDRAKQLGTAEALKLALRQTKSILPGQELIHVLRRDSMRDHDGDQGIVLPRAAADNLLGAGPFEELPTGVEALLTCRAVDPRLNMCDRVEAKDDHPLALNRGRWVDLRGDETRDTLLRHGSFPSATPRMPSRCRHARVGR